jgi:hypothetical protein
MPPDLPGWHSRQIPGPLRIRIASATGEDTVADGAHRLYRYLASN